MDKWTKWFRDGTNIETESGTDKDIAAGKASWSRGRLQGMYMAGASMGKMHLAIRASGPADFWQSDDYETLVLVDGPARKTHRRLQRKIQSQDAAVRVLQTKHSVMLDVVTAIWMFNSPSHKQDHLFPLHGDEVGMWLTLECDGKNFKWYLSKERI